LPVELAGRSALPAITAEPLQLTLGPFAFYWFSLEPRGETAARISREPLPRVDLGRDGPFGPPFAAALVGYLSSRDALFGEVSDARIEGAIEVGDARAALLGVDYLGGERDAFVVPWTRAEKEHATDGRAFASAAWRVVPGEAAQVLLDDTEGFARALGIDARGARAAESPSGLVRVTDLTEAREPAVEAPWSLLSSTKERAVYASSGHVLEVSRRLVEGESPAVQIAAALAGTGLVPRVYRAVDYVSARGVRSPLALVREYVEGEGNLRDFAMRDVSLAYERALASGLECPSLPSSPLVAVASEAPPPELSELITVSREWAVRFGRRTAALHTALARSTSPDLVPAPYTTFDRRSRYQSSRNAVGRFLETLDAVAKQPTGGSGLDGRVLALLGREARMLAAFTPLLDTPIDACRIRIHGRLELSCVLRTAADFVFTDFAPSTSGHRASALRDVARLVRSLDEAAHEALSMLRPEDRLRARPFGESWALWTSAAFVSGYLESASGTTFVPSRSNVTSLLLETALVESALVQARVELDHAEDDGPALARVIRAFA
jgi:maltose alpha-D-glucosyltransferase/alpha-amylase